MSDARGDDDGDDGHVGSDQEVDEPSHNGRSLDDLVGARTDTHVQYYVSTRHAQTRTEVSTRHAQTSSLNSQTYFVYLFNFLWVHCPIFLSHSIDVFNCT